MFNRRKILTQDEIEKLIADFDNEIFNDSDSDWDSDSEPTNSENLSNSADNEENDFGSKNDSAKESDLIWRDAVESDKASIYKFEDIYRVKGAAENASEEIDYFFSIFTKRTYGENSRWN